jgi:hypothetical protein
MLSRTIIKSYLLHISIVLYLILILGVHMMKPGFIYNKEGGFRPFGIGYKHKTVIPMFVISIVLAILSYVMVSNI